MPAAGNTKAEILDQLMVTFRTGGFDGASLSDLSAATGLGKSSLYHYFPGGKTQMATEVLGHLATSLERNLLAPLRGSATPAAKLDALLRTLSAFYDKGRMPCLLERLCASVDAPLFHTPLSQAFTSLIGGIQHLCESAGIPRGDAKERAEDAVIRIEGSLIVGAGLGDPATFTRTLTRLRRTLLARD
jgi:AcrR family transcriptional regulator